VTAIVGWQIDTIGFVVGGDYDSGYVGHLVFRDVFFVDAQYIQRSDDVEFGTVVEFETVGLAEIMRFIDAQDHRPSEWIEGGK
jgi:hypothetical protein